MRRAAVLATVVLVVAWASVCTALPKNMTEMHLEWFTAHEFAPHKLVSDEGTYEVQEYEAAAWACAERDASIMREEEVVKMFTALARYIKGKNSLGAELKMTGPVTLYNERSPQGGLKMQMCYYIPSKHQANPPKPSVQGVTIHKKDKMKIAARSFVVEKNSMEEWEAEKLALQKALMDAGVKNVNFDNCYGAMYNPPGTKEHIKEVWYQMQG